MFLGSKEYSGTVLKLVVFEFHVQWLVRTGKKKDLGLSFIMSQVAYPLDDSSLLSVCLLLSIIHPWKLFYYYFSSQNVYPNAIYVNMNCLAYERLNARTPQLLV